MCTCGHIAEATRTKAEISQCTELRAQSYVHRAAVCRRATLRTGSETANQFLLKLCGFEFVEVEIVLSSKILRYTMVLFSRFVIYLPQL